MDMNTYALEMLVRDRLERARREAAAHALATRVPRASRATLRLRLGLLLVGLGRWLRCGRVYRGGGVGGVRGDRRSGVVEARLAPKVA